MIATLVLPEALQAQLAAEARAAFPRECCGLVEGFVGESALHATALHPTPNLATAPNRFEIDPARHIALLRRLRGTDRSVIGCYHSHPNGRDEPSAHDRESAGEVNFVWLIVALERAAAPSRIAAFVSNGTAFAHLHIETV